MGEGLFLDSRECFSEEEYFLLSIDCIESESNFLFLSNFSTSILQVKVLVVLGLSA